ncbi:hypothetical protein [Paenibacillus turpanensis]|uniref:hypothetical protein n=1 Tax=Paenibacillus turpanensis TaxID=2689078 RepID=UPI0014075B68|nr:hypothetical protein [Paenibacillus turpanensis]
MQLSELELQNLRHLIGKTQNDANKLETYAQQATDPQIKQAFQQEAATARATQQTLITFLK